jgi:endonuclease/exonuclease/phosphatase family metal-dependent hydrolase
MQLRLLSLNVWGLPWPVSSIPDARMRMIASDLPTLELDAAAFQEVWTPGAREILLEGGRRAGLVHSWHRDGLLGNSGLLVLSRWPILQTRFTRFALGGLPQRLHHADYYGGKGFAQCRLEVPGGEFELFATHLQAGYGRVGYADEYLGHRVAQMIELALGVATTDRPLAVLGDLNSRPRRDEMSVLLGATGLIDVAVAIGRDVPTLLPYSPYGPDEEPLGKRIDYTLARAGKAVGVRPVEAIRTFDTEFVLGGRRATFSDHTGVLAELDLGGPGRPLPAPAVHTLQRARRALKHGKRGAKRRRDEQRVGGASAALLAVGSGATAHYTRRHWLRRAGFALASVSLLPTATWLGLSEGFTPSELASYETVEAALAELERLAEERAR